jgi:hypothetical protein
VAFATALLAGPGALVMWGCWEYGWLNSFHKGYEVRAAGAVVTLLIGWPLFIAAMLYLPLATAHFAASGQTRSFFDFGFVGRIIRVKPLAYLGLIAAIALLSLPVEILKVAPYFFNGDRVPWMADASDAEILRFLRGYRLVHGVLLFVVVVLTRHLAARIYASGLLAMVRRGDVTAEELPGQVRSWLERLDLLTPPEPRSSGWLLAAGRGTWWLGRRGVYVLAGLIGVLFVAKTYVSEFLHYHPAAGFLNHPVLMLPCVDYIPWHLTSALDSVKDEDHDLDPK